MALARISRLRAIGLPLKSIAPLVGARDGGAALRERLRALDATLEAEIAERAERRARIAQVLEEEIDDAIAVSAADVWEERSIALLRASIPDLTPEQERVERRFARALSALIPPQAATDEDEDEAVEAIAALASGSSLQEVATLHRRFHELAGAPEDDPRVEPLAAEFSRSFHALLERVLASLPEPEAWDPEPAEQERLRMGMAAALEVLSPAQRRVMELILASVVDGP